MPNDIVECPLKPEPEPSRLIAPIGSTPPSNACTRERCAWWMNQFDPRDGRTVVGGGCAIGYASIALVQINARLAMFEVNAAPPPASGAKN